MRSPEIERALDRRPDDVRHEHIAMPPTPAATKPPMRAETLDAINRETRPACKEWFELDSSGNPPAPARRRE